MDTRNLQFLSGYQIMKEQSMGSQYGPVQNLLHAFAVV